MFPRPVIAALVVGATLALGPASGSAHATTADEHRLLGPVTSPAPDSWLCDYFKNLPGCPIKRR